MTKKIGTTVYCIYLDSIIVNHIGYVGNDAFIIEEFSEDVMHDSLMWFWDDYNVTWFTSFEKAKKKLLSEQSHKGKVIQLADDYYEFRTKEELVK